MEISDPNNRTFNGALASERWEREQAYFDNEEYSEGPIPPNTIERYTLCRRPFLLAEYPFWILGDVRGKRALELGCGDGGKAIMMALRGAEVVGIDISPRAIEIARARAQMHGVADRTKFYAMPLETFVEQAHGQFDIICGFAVLHHLLPTLDRIFEDLKKMANERTVFVFQEPVALSPLVRRLRLALPLKTYGTPDERPLEPRDLVVLRRHLPDLQIRQFALLIRAWDRFVGGRYEDYPRFQRTLVTLLGRFDQALLSLPGFRALAALAVLHTAPGRVNAGAAAR